MSQGNPWERRRVQEDAAKLNRAGSTRMFDERRHARYPGKPHGELTGQMLYWKRIG